MTEQQPFDLLTVLDKRKVRQIITERYGNVEFQIMHAISVLWSGFEMDNQAALVELEDGRRDIVILHRTHSREYDPSDVALLASRVRVYEEAVKETRALLAILAAGDRRWRPLVNDILKLTEGCQS